MPDSTLLQRIEALLAEVQTIDVRLAEGAPAEAIRADLVPALDQALSAAMTLQDDARRMYPEDTALTPSRADDSGIFALQIDRAMLGDGRSRIVDVLVLGRLELVARSAALARLHAGSDPWCLIDACASARRKILKVLSALAHAICSYHGIADPSGWHRSELEISLAIRREYTRFRRAITPIPEPAPEDVRRRLREAGTLLAKLIGKDIYHYLRTTDRRQIRAVQERILDWLRARDPPTRHGVRIWQDFTALAGLLVQVNLRAELRDHDFTAASDVWRTIGAGDPEAPIGADALARLARLFGRDDELDAMLDATPETPRWVFRETVERIVRDLSPPPVQPSADLPLEDTL